MSNKPWWWPERATPETVTRLRKDYPEISEQYESDESLLEHFDYSMGEFMDTWDHVGDARSEYQILAAAFLKLVEDSGKSPADFS